jgi:hypothetical protein
MPILDPVACSVCGDVFPGGSNALRRHIPGGGRKGKVCPGTYRPGVPLVRKLDNGSELDDDRPVTKTPPSHELKFRATGVTPGYDDTAWLMCSCGEGVEVEDLTMAEVNYLAEVHLEGGTVYWLRESDSHGSDGWRQVSKGEWVAAERFAGFNNMLGRITDPATGAWSKITGMPGTSFYRRVQGRIRKPGERPELEGEV